MSSTGVNIALGKRTLRLLNSAALIQSGLMLLILYIIRTMVALMVLHLHQTMTISRLNILH